MNRKSVLHLTDGGGAEGDVLLAVPAGWNGADAIGAIPEGTVGAESVRRDNQWGITAIGDGECLSNLIADPA